MSRRLFEEDRLKYIPMEVNVLFVAESQRDNTFFYHKNSKFYMYIKEALNSVYGWRLGEGEEFLRKFKGLGCYFLYFLDEPDAKVRDLSRRELGELTAVFARKIDELEPKAIIVLDEDLELYVKRALRMMELNVPVYTISLTGPGDVMDKYIRQLTEILSTLKEAGVLGELE